MADQEEPLLPTKHSAGTANDTPHDRSITVAAHRAHQSWWRETVLGWPAGPPTSPAAKKRYAVLGSCIAYEFEGQSAVADGVNLMSAAAREYARDRQRKLAALGGLAEPDRLWRNLLSSQPLAFSIAGELRHHPNAAARVFATMIGDSVITLEHLEDDLTPSHRLGGVEAEWFPPREHHTADRSGFDLAAYLGVGKDQRLLVTVEVKYTDTFSATRASGQRYGHHVTAAGLDANAMSDIVAAGGSQFLRSVLLTDSLRQRGLRGGPGVGRTLAVVLARADDASARKVVDVVRSHEPTTQVALWSHEQLFAACADEPELADWAARMTTRYTLPNAPQGTSR